MEILRAAGADVRLCLPFEVDKEYELPRDLRFHRLDRELPGADAAICFGGDGTILHIANERIPFGGVGRSGMGCYHGYDSFTAFSHRRSVVETTTAFDLPLRYMPYSLFRWIKGLL